MKKWQHEETGSITEAKYPPGNRWHELKPCEHNIVGCIMSPGHSSCECYTEEMRQDEEKQSTSVIPWGGTTVLDISPKQVIEGLKDKNFKQILVIGIEQDGTLYTSSHTSDIPKILFNIRHAERFFEKLAFSDDWED